VSGMSTPDTVDVAQRMGHEGLGKLEEWAQ
jgi:hypothetical protein